MNRLLVAVVAVCVSLSVLAQPASCPSVQWNLGGPNDDVGTNNYLRELAGVDWDEDGKLDMVGVIDWPHERTLAWWKGNGDGTFGTRNELGTVFWFTNILIADATGDGRDDVIVGNTNQQVWIYPATGSGRGARIESYLTAQPGILYAANRDADPAVELYVSDAPGHRFLVYDNITAYSATELANVSMTGNPKGIVAADFDDDGILDVAVGSNFNAQRMEIYFGNADNTYDAPLQLPVDDPWDVRTGDLNEDGLPDLVVGNWEVDFTLSKPATVSVYLNLGSRNFAHSTISIENPGDLGNTTGLLLEDISGDGHLDLIADPSNDTYDLTTMLGRGDGTFRSATYRLIETGANEFVSPIAMATGNFQGDAKLELALGSFYHFFTATSSCTSQVYLYTVSPLISSGQNATLHAYVSGFGADTPAPLGTVTLREGDVVLQTLTAGADGHVEFTVPNLNIGTHLLTAEFSGNAAVAGATSRVLTQKVTANTTSVLITLPPLPKAYGDPFPVQITIQNAGDDFVRVTVDGVLQQKWHYTPNALNLALQPGDHTISAKYLGTLYSPASESGLVAFTIGKGAANIISTAGSLTVRQNTAHSLTFNVTGAGAQQPGGTLQLIEGTTVIASGALTNGSVTLNATLTRGAHDVRVVYSGDARYLTSEQQLTLEVLQNVELAIEARGLANGVHIAYVLPPDTNMSSLQLLRRQAGTAGWATVSWNAATGMDTTVPARGIAYEYQLNLLLNNGSARSSAIDAAMLFNDDLLVAGVGVKRAHFNELRTAINLMRTKGGLGAFHFDATFEVPGNVRASHIAALRTALTQARSQLGMTTAAFTGAGEGTLIRATHVQELRELAR